MSSKRSFYRYTETPLYIKDTPADKQHLANTHDYPEYVQNSTVNKLDYMYSTSAGLSISASTPPLRTLGSTQLHKYFPDGPLTATLNTDFYLNAATQRIVTTTGESAELHGQLAGFNFGQMYLNSFSVNMEPYAPALISADFSIYRMSSDKDASSSSAVNDDYRFTGSPTSLGVDAELEGNNLNSKAGGPDPSSFPPPVTLDLLSTHNHVMSDVQGLNRSTYGIQHPVSITFSEQFERQPIYVVGKRHPVEVNLGAVNRELTIQGEDIGKVISFQGHDKGSEGAGTKAKVSIALRTIGTENQPGAQMGRLLEISGVVDTQDISVSAGGFMEGSVTIKESVR